MKTVKLSRQQLRGLILSEVKTAKRRLQEMPGRKMKVSAQETWALQGSIENAVLEFFEGMYDPSDPSMEATGGEEAWRDQCMEATNDLVNDDDFVKELDRVVFRLVNGEYHRDRR